MNEAQDIFINPVWESVRYFCQDKIEVKMLSPMFLLQLLLLLLLVMIFCQSATCVYVGLFNSVHSLQFRLKCTANFLMLLLWVFHLCHFTPSCSCGKLENIEKFLKLSVFKSFHFVLLSSPFCQPTKCDIY